MKRRIVFAAAIVVASTATGATPPTPAMSCTGYYVTPQQSGGFSVQVEASVVELVYADFSPRSLSRYTRNRDGSITFYIDNGAASQLRCDAAGATITIAASDTYLHNPEQSIHTPARRIRLSRYTDNIFRYARSRGWAIGD